MQKDVRGEGCDVSVTLFQLFLYVDGNVTIYAACAFLLVDVCMLHLRMFRRIVHCRREASMAAVWHLPIHGVEKKKRMHQEDGKY